MTETHYQIIYNDKKGVGCMRHFTDSHECWKFMQKLFIPARVVDPETKRYIGGIEQNILVWISRKVVPVVGGGTMTDFSDLVKKYEATTREQKWVHGKTPRLSFEEMRSEYAASLKATLDHFGGDFLNQVHGVYFEDNETRVAITGISPNSPNNAEFIAAIHNEFPRLMADLEELQKQLHPLGLPNDTNLIQMTFEFDKLRQQLAEQAEEIAGIRAALQESSEACLVSIERETELQRKVAALKQETHGLVDANQTMIHEIDALKQSLSEANERVRELEGNLFDADGYIVTYLDELGIEIKRECHWCAAEFPNPHNENCSWLKKGGKP